MVRPQCVAKAVAFWALLPRLGSDEHCWCCQSCCFKQEKSRQEPEQESAVLPGSGLCLAGLQSLLTGSSITSSGIQGCYRAAKLWAGFCLQNPCELSHGKSKKKNKT